MGGVDPKTLQGKSTGPRSLVVCRSRKKTKFNERFGECYLLHEYDVDVAVLGLASEDNVPPAGTAQDLKGSDGEASQLEHQYHNPGRHHGNRRKGGVR